MKKRLLRRVLSLFFAFAVVFSFACPFFVIGAEEKPLRYCYTNGYINFRAEPNLSARSYLQFGKHQVLPILGEASGATVSGSTLWYKVRYTHMADGKCYVGYVHSTLVTVCAPFDYSTSAFSEFPESYRPYLAALKAAHPTWSFVPLDTGKDFSAAVSEQAVVSSVTSGGVTTLTSSSFIGRDVSSIYRSTSVVAGLDASKTLLDGGKMYCASASTVAYYMDPRNFLNEVDVFMFSAQTYDATLHTLERVENMIKGTYMETLKTPNAEGVEVSYAQAFLDAAKATGISPFYLLITSFSENGTVGTNLSKGNLEGGVCSAAGCSDVAHRGYYNFFGIGSTPEGSPQHNGLMYAINHGWDTAYKAILGGASFQGDNYITNGQGTSYLKKFNVNPASPNGIWHQYMQNLQHPETEALFTFRSMQDNSLMELSHEFQIPVYKNMPEAQSALPNVETYAPDSPGGSTPSPDAPTKPVFSTSYRLDYTGFISGIAPGTAEEEFRSKFSLGADTTLSVSSPTISTGTEIRVLLRGSPYYTFYAVVRGDLSGNGQTDTLDLLYLRDYLLGIRGLNNVYTRAADIDASGTVDTLDLLKLRDALLGTYTINQEA